MSDIIAAIFAFSLAILIASNIVDCIKTDDLIDTSVKVLCTICFVVFGFMFISRYFNPILPCDCNDENVELKEYVIEIKNDSIINIYKYE
jgi:predicted histidine transporter YuiF (NhaC family)